MDGWATAAGGGMKSVFALDVSARACGWGYGFPDGVPTSGVVRFGVDGGTEDEAWARCLRWTNDQIAVLSPDIVAIEAPIMSTGGGFTNPKTQSMLWGLQAVIRTVVKLRQPGCAVLVNVATARKVFTGRGRFESGEAKGAVQTEALRRGWLDAGSMDPDRADALAVWCAVAAEQRPELAFAKSKPRRLAHASAEF